MENMLLNMVKKYQNPRALILFRGIILLINFSQLNNMGIHAFGREISKTRNRTTIQISVSPLCDRESAITIEISMLFYF